MMNAYEKVVDLAYGENPHQRAAFYQQLGSRMHVLSMVRQLGGKDLSFNNLLDLNAGRLLVSEFEVPACAIIKHNNPCGCAVGASTRSRSSSLRVPCPISPRRSTRTSCASGCGRRSTRCRWRSASP